MLHRLKLGADGLTESDLDLIYRNNEYLSIADVIMKEDFLNVFGMAIQQAKRERNES